MPIESTGGTESKMVRGIPGVRRSLWTAELYCPERKRLLEQFGETVRELTMLHESQFFAVLADDPDVNRFDILIHYANEKKQNAKYAYMSHLEEHGCEVTHETDISGTRAHDRQHFEAPVGAPEPGCD